jgi:hypothetical protein
MTDAEQELAELEIEMNALVGLRNERVRTGQAMIDQANREFDKAAVSLGRKINVLRESLVIKPPPPPPRNTVYREPDPDWEPEDVAHYHELQRRESVGKSR